MYNRKYPTRRTRFKHLRLVTRRTLAYSHIAVVVMCVAFDSRLIAPETHNKGQNCLIVNRSVGPYCVFMRLCVHLRVGGRVDEAVPHQRGARTNSRARTYTHTHTQRSTVRTLQQQQLLLLWLLGHSIVAARTSSIRSWNT